MIRTLIHGVIAVCIAGALFALLSGRQLAFLRLLVLAVVLIWLLALVPMLGGCAPIVYPDPHDSCRWDCELERWHLG